MIRDWSPITRLIPNNGGRGSSRIFRIEAAKGAVTVRWSRPDEQKIDGDAKADRLTSAKWAAVFAFRFPANTEE